MFGAVQIAYETAYAMAHFGNRGAAALSSHHTVGIDGYQTQRWPAFLVDCLPQGYGRQELLRQLGMPERIEASGDWQLLAHGAGNPIGNLRITQAHDWLAQRSQTSSSPGFSRQEVATRGERFTEHLASNGLFVAGSSGVQGEWPKILLTEDKHGLLHLDHLLPDSEAHRHYIVKFARGNIQRLNDILRLESLWMVLAQHIGLRVHALPVLQGRALFIARFDRSVLPVGRGILRHGQESLYSLCRCEAGDDSVTHNDAVLALAQVATDPLAEVCEYLRRDVANIVLGNKDNHGRNTAVQRREDGWVGLTPVFDFAPMYLHPDGIARRIRWQLGGKADTGSPDWAEVAGVCTQLVCNSPRAQQAKLQAHAVQKRLRSTLHSMALAVADLPHAMQLVGVETDVINHLRLGIEHNAERLAQC